MSNKKDNFKLLKAVFEVKYPAAAALFDNRGRIASEWQFKGDLDLTEWRISNNQVVVHNKAQTTLLSAGYSGILIVQELPRNTKSFTVLATDFAISILDLLKPPKANRLGLRMYYVAERKHFKGSVQTIGKRFYRLDEEDWAVFGGFPEDVGLHFTLKQGDNKVNYRFGPMEKEQYRRDEIFVSNDTFEKLPDSSLMIDFDLFRPNPSGAPLGELVKSFCDNGRVIIEDHVNRFQNRFGEF